ncbi:MAG: hypothetical protein ACJARG_000031 [Arcticibacterium sp.]|jgi:hypothetical protein
MKNKSSKYSLQKTLQKYIVMSRSLLQALSLWTLKKTKYQFKIEHDKFEIQVQPVGLGETPTRYDFVCTHKDIGFMNYIEMTRYFYVEELLDCPKPKAKGVKFNDEPKVKNLEKQYNNLIKSVINSSRVVI